MCRASRVNFRSQVPPLTSSRHHRKPQLEPKLTSNPSQIVKLRKRSWARSRVGARCQRAGDDDDQHYDERVHIRALDLPRIFHPAKFLALLTISLVALLQIQSALAKTPTTQPEPAYSPQEPKLWSPRAPDQKAGTKSAVARPMESPDERKSVGPRQQSRQAAIDTGEQPFESLRKPAPKQQPSEQPALSFRQATNRNASSLMPTGSQWIPIRGGDSQTKPVAAPNMSHQPARSPASTAKPQSPRNSQSNGGARSSKSPTTSSSPHNRPPQPTQPPAARASSQGAAVSPRAASNRLHAEASRNHQFYRPPMSHYGDGRWRRPRLSSAPDDLELRAHQHYKRVLLCDKTLVSLDYVRAVDLEPRPLPFGASPLYDGPNSALGDNFIDNFVDADSTLVELAAAPNRTSPLARAAELEPAAANAIPLEELDRRSHLADEDPLVKCDMWDLEKGLKNRKPPDHILRQAHKADFDTVRDAINRCRQLSERALPAEDEYRDHGIEVMSTEDLVSLFSMKRGLIPGTKWCGLGDQASSYNDLGPKHRIDICCRAHDHCPIRLKPFRNDYGVLNIALYTKSHCDCDADFYRCLREVRSRTADMLGNLYFNVMKLQCMREERLKVCRELRPVALGFERCIRYEESPVKTVFKFTTPPVAY